MGTFFNGDYSFQSNLTSFDMGNTTFANNSAYSMFSGCSNFNQPMVIPNYLTNVSNMFVGCYNFNSPIIIHPNANIISMDWFMASDHFSQDINIPYGAVNWRDVIRCTAYHSNVFLYANYAGWTSSNVGDYINAFSGSNFNGNVIFQHTPVNMSNMFAYCSYLNQNIQIPTGTNQNCYSMFRGCFNMNRTIKLPNNVDASWAFASCTNLSKSISIPTNSNISLMFSGCTNFNASMYVPAFPQGSESDSYNGYDIFKDCNSLNASVTFDDSITVLNNTFYNCRSLNLPITLPSNLKYGYGTFSSCVSLNTPITLPNGLISMRSMFSSSAMNVNITIPESVTEMNSAFAYSSMNQLLTLPNNLLSLGSTFRNCKSFNQSIVIPETVEYCISTFQDCTNLNTAIVIPNNVKDVTGMFWNCANLYMDELNIPVNVTRIQNFAYRTLIKNVGIDSSLIQWPFANFVSLPYNTINVDGKTPATTCSSIQGLFYHPTSFGDDVAHIRINNNCIVNKSGTTMSFNGLWNDTQGTWGIVWENMFGGIGVSIAQFFNQRNYYNNHPIGHLQVLLAGYDTDYREIYYHDLMNAWVNQQSSVGYEWNVYHVNLSFY